MYLDTSAVVKLARDEPGSQQFAQFVRTVRTTSSALVIAEVGRALARFLPTADDVRRVASLVDRTFIYAIDERIIARAAAVQPVSLRTLDAIHLATIERLAPALDGVVTYDARLAEAVRAMGVVVMAPGDPI